MILLSNRSELGKGNGRHGIEVAAGADNTQLTNNQMQSNALDGFHVFGTGNKLQSNSANANVDAELTIGPGNVDQGGNKANRRSCTFDADGGAAIS
jgi:parallel beta-helix repeat protein